MNVFLELSPFSNHLDYHLELGRLSFKQACNES